MEWAHIHDSQNAVWCMQMLTKIQSGSSTSASVETMSIYKIELDHIIYRGAKSVNYESAVRQARARTSKKSKY